MWNKNHRYKILAHNDKAVYIQLHMIHSDDNVNKWLDLTREATYDRYLNYRHIVGKYISQFFIDFTN